MDLQHTSILNPSDENHSLIPRKRRRSSAHHSRTMNRDRDRDRDRDHDNDVRMASDPYLKAHGNGTMTVSSKHADRNVAPFLAKHIPEQHTPSDINNKDNPHSDHRDQTSVHCCRHRAETKCRRQADESTMDNLQRELQTLSQGDQLAISHVWSLFSAAPSKHRNLMLRGILTQCCLPQLSLISATVRDLIRIDFLTALPPEISFRILCYLDTASLCKAAQVSRRWRYLADDDVVWHRMCEQHIDRKCTKCGWGLPLLDRKRLRATKRRIQLRAAGRGINEWSPKLTPLPESTPPVDPSAMAISPASNGPDDKRKAEDDDTSTSAKKPFMLDSTDHEKDDYFKTRFRPWKDVYRDRFMVGTNWKYGRCNTKIFKGHSIGVMCLQFEDNILATGSYDSTIKIWNTDTVEEIRTLRGHESGIRCLQFDDTKLVSGSMDRSLKIWNWRTGECISTYKGHSGGVISLHFDSRLLVSGSMDKTIKVWNFDDKSTFVLRGHTDWVNSVKLESASRTVFSASDDCTARMWDLDTKSCIRVFEGHVGQVQHIQPLPDEFDFEEEHEGECDDDGASTTSANTPGESHSHHDQPQTGALTPSSSSNETLAQYFGDGFTHDRPSPPRYMLTGALDATIRLWETSTGRCLRTFFGHVEGVWALAASNLRVVSGAEDRMVKIWDPRTGKCERTFTGHAGPVTCVDLGDSRLATGSDDGEVRMYFFRNY